MDWFWHVTGQHNTARLLLDNLLDGMGMGYVHLSAGRLDEALPPKDSSGAKKAFRLAVLAYEEVGSPRGTGLALLGLAAVEATEGRSDRAVAIAEAARSLTERAGVVCDHPMDPGVVERIEELKVALKPQDVDVILEEASELSPSEVLAMVGQQ